MSARVGRKDVVGDADEVDVEAGGLADALQPPTEGSGRRKLFADTEVRHIYAFRGHLVRRMTIEE